jgi:hypothetical protein
MYMYRQGGRVKFIAALKRRSVSKNQTQCFQHGSYMWPQKPVCTAAAAAAAELLTRCRVAV